MDVSGDQESGNHKYLCIFMGTQNGMGRIFHELRRHVRMDDIRRKRRKNTTLDGVVFDGNESIALCVRIDRDPIISRVKQMRRSRKTSEGKIRKAYHQILFHMIKDRMEGFALRHGVLVTDMSFQCDSDCRNFIRDVGLKQDPAGDAHAIADIVAWANNKGTEPSGVIPLDMSSRLEERLRQLMRRK